MPPPVFLIVGFGALAHVMVGRWVGSPWLIPDLTLVSLVVAISRVPGSPMTPALFGGLLAMLLTIHRPVFTGFAYIGAGWFVKSLAARWDLAHRSLQLVVISMAEGLLLAVQLLMPLADPSTATLNLGQFELNRQTGIEVSASLLMLSGVKVMSTVLCLLAWHQLVTWFHRLRRAPSGPIN